MKIFYNKAFKNYFLLMITLLLTEVIFRLLTNIPIIDWSMLRIFIGVNFISFLLGVINSFFGRVIGDILIFVVSFFFSVYAILEVMSLNYFGYFLSFSASSQLSRVSDCIGTFLGSFTPILLVLLIPNIILVIFYLVIEKRTHIMEMNDSIDFSDKFASVERKELNKQKTLKKKKRLLLTDRISVAVFAIISAAVYILTLNIGIFNNEFQLKSARELFSNPDMPNLAIKEFGFTGYSLIDFKTSIIKPKNSLDGYPFRDTYQKQKQVESDFTRYIDDTAWEKIINDEKIPTYKTLNNYYISQNITDKNDYTGFFKDKNLIVISMDSVNNLIINEKYFPNIYKLYDEGWSFTNSYSPRTICGSGNSEFSAMTSLYTINNKCTINDYKNNKYYESIFNLFNNYQYNTSSFYNYNDKYYIRKIVHPNMGANKYFDAQSLGIPFKNTYGQWPSDIDLMNEFLDEINPDEKFMTWITTSTTGEPYNKNSQYGDLHIAEFKDTNYNIELKRYLSKLKVLDDAIGTLVNGLEDKGILDDTVIVLYSNHTPYSLSESDLDKKLDNVNYHNDIDKTPFIIYNSLTSPTKRSEYTSYINILPTIANLFDLEYDPRLYMGSDIFSKDYDNRIVFSDGSWQDKKAFYDATTNKIDYVSKTDTYTDEEIKRINETIKNKYLISSLSIKTNYFNYLDTKLKEYKVSVLPTSNE